MVVHKGIRVQAVSPTEEILYNKQAFNALLPSENYQQNYEIPKKNYQLEHDEQIWHTQHTLLR